VARSCVAFATVMTQGASPGPLTLPGSGPSLPAATTTTTPASRALSIALESLRVHGLDGLPPIE
jgi:hypothetical protein